MPPAKSTFYALSDQLFWDHSPLTKSTYYIEQRNRHKLKLHFFIYILKKTARENIQ